MKKLPPNVIWADFSEKGKTLYYMKKQLRKERKEIPLCERIAQKLAKAGIK